MAEALTSPDAVGPVPARVGAPANASAEEFFYREDNFRLAASDVRHRRRHLRR
jgi:hypothetical protein